MTDGERRRLGIDLNRRSVQRAVVPKKPHNPARRAKLQTYPVCIFTLREPNPLLLNLQIAVTNPERNGFAGGAFERAIRSREARERALRAPQIGRAHGREQTAVKLLRGKC